MPTEKLAEALLRPINTSAVIILGVYTAVWGLWLAAPWWSVFSRAPLYAAMGVLAPEWVWGLMALAVGCLIIYGAFKRSYRTLANGSVAAAWHWGVVAVFYFCADWMSTGGITSLAFAVYGAFIYLNIRVNRVLPEQQIKKQERGGSL